MVAVVFPGQGSQKPGMGQELFEASVQAREAFERVSQATDVDLQELCFRADEETLRQTQHAQLALYTCGLAAWLALEAALTEGDRRKIVALAGHSVGEYAALAAADVFSVEEGARLVLRRGELMAQAGQEAPGTMAAVLGMERADLEAALAEVEGVVAIANDNCPGQLVISGEVEAVRRAGEAATQRGAKRVLPLNVSGAFHSPLMENAAQEMTQALAGAVFGFPSAQRKVYANVTAEPVEDADDWKDLLERQLRNPVRWTETVRNMTRNGITAFVECGVGDVLGGLIRRTEKGARTLRVSDTATLAEAVEALSAEA
jgi:[acyl-carrier-protein] S-malonyltransferase